MCALHAPPKAELRSAGMAKKKNPLWRYWGIIAFVVAIAGWLTSDIGPAGISVLSVLSFLWFLFQAPVPCGALNRGDTDQCRNNGRGVLRGCHLKQHQWQRLKGLVLRQRMRRITQELFPNPTTTLASLGAIVALLSSSMGLVQAVAG